MIKFEKVSRFNSVDFEMPCRKTDFSAGYDMVVAEDITIPPYDTLNRKMSELLISYPAEGITLSDMANITKSIAAKPTLVSTGVKCYLDEGFYLELSVRSSTPLKHWLVLANGIGIIDADYADNEANEGEIFFQLINLSPYPIALKKGDIIGQGIIKKYYLTDNDDLAQSKDKARKRTGGFGSTSERVQ